ncbi:MAG: hypothetical protein AABW73_04225 [Nanoarchaeota archaeon]
MNERVENGSYIHVTGYVTEEGLVRVAYHLEQITTGENEASGGGARRKFADKKSLAELGDLLATNPEFGGGSDKLNFLHLRPARKETLFCVDDTEYEDGKFGYRFERPARDDELAEIIQTYAKAIKPFCAAP